jgi:hypothetical protein
MILRSTITSVMPWQVKELPRLETQLLMISSKSRLSRKLLTAYLRSIPSHCFFIMSINPRVTLLSTPSGSTHCRHPPGSLNH